MAGKVKVALIGGGRTGTPLLKAMLKLNYIDIIGVADMNPKAQSIKLARKEGIFTTPDPMELVKKGRKIDVLIEVTGDMKLKRKIKSHFEKTNNRKTVIMHDLIARLFISVLTCKKSLVPSFHPKDIGVGK